MKRLLSPMLLFLAAGLLPASNAAAEVIGAESRSRLTEQGHETFAGVGRLVCADPLTGHRTFTTATLVGNRNTIVGVGHFRRSQTVLGVRSVGIEHCRFNLYDRSGAAIFESAIANPRTARPAEDYVPALSGTPDWAVLELVRAAPPSVTPLRLRPITVRSLARQSEVFMIGYHSSPSIPAHDLVYSPDCRPRPWPRSALLFRHSCDTSAGSSGSLLYIVTGEGPRAVAINYAYEGEGGSNLGQVFLSDLLAVLPPEAIDRAPTPARATATLSR